MAGEQKAFRFPDEEAEDPNLPDGEPQVDADGEDDLEVEIVDDTPEQDRGRKPLNKQVEDPTDEELAQYGKRSQERIRELTHARHDERRKAERAERELQEAQRVARALFEQNKNLRGIVENGTKVYNESAVKLAEREVEDAKRQLREAQDSYDNDQIVEAQDALFQARIRLEKVKDMPAAPLQEVDVAVQTQQSQFQKPQIDEKSLSWQQKNQWFGRPGNEDATSFALGLDLKLRRQGLDPRSDEYYEQIDARMREKFPEVVGDDTPARQTDFKPKPSSAKPNVVASVSRTGSVGRVRLTSTQVALASRLGLTPQQYAAELVKLEKRNG